MAATLALVPPLAPEPPSDSATMFARDLVAQNPEIAARIFAALQRLLP